MLDRVIISFNLRIATVIQQKEDPRLGYSSQITTPIHHTQFITVYYSQFPLLSSYYKHLLKFIGGIFQSVQSCLKFISCKGEQLCNNVLQIQLHEGICTTVQHMYSLMKKFKNLKQNPLLCIFSFSLAVNDDDYHA